MEVASNLFMGVARREPSPNTSHCLIRELCVVVALAGTASRSVIEAALLDAVLNVIRLGSRCEMGRINASRRVAGVKEFQAIGDSPVSQLPGYAMSAGLLPVRLAGPLIENPITAAAQSALPKPTGVGLKDLLPKAISNGANVGAGARGGAVSGESRLHFVAKGLELLAAVGALLGDARTNTRGRIGLHRKPHFLVPDPGALLRSRGHFTSNSISFPNLFSAFCFGGFL